MKAAAVHPDDHALFTVSGELQLAVERPPHIQRYSRIYAARSPRVPGLLAVKVCLVPGSSRPDDGEAARQYGALVRVASKMTDPAYRVPEPLLLLPGAVVMRWEVGTALTQALREARDISARLRCMEQAGAWLARFHGAHRLPAAPLDVASKVSEVRVLRQRSDVSDAAFATCARWLESSASTVQSLAVPRSWLHGDYKIDNLLLTQTGVVGFDVQLTYENPSLYDVAAFLNHLAVGLADPRRWRIGRAAPLLERTFGVAAMGDDWDRLRSAVKWERVYNLLAQWDYANRNTRDVLHRTALRIMFRRVANRLLRVQ